MVRLPKKLAQLKFPKFLTSTWGRRFAWAVVGGTVLGVLGAAVVWWRICAGDACPSVEQLEKYRPRQASRVFAADGRLIGDLGLERRTVIRLSALPRTVIDAFVITEDKRFYEHHGVDYRRIIGSTINNIKALGVAEGFSTLTMQLARNVFPEQITRERHGLAGLTRKLKEMRQGRRSAGDVQLPRPAALLREHVDR